MKKVAVIDDMESIELMLEKSADRSFMLSRAVIKRLLKSKEGSLKDIKINGLQINLYEKKLAALQEEIKIRNAEIELWKEKYYRMCSRKNE